MAIRKIINSVKDAWVEAERRNNFDMQLSSYRHAKNPFISGVFSAAISSTERLANKFPKNADVAANEFLVRFFSSIQVSPSGFAAGCSLFKRLELR